MRSDKQKKHGSLQPQHVAIIGQAIWPALVPSPLGRAKTTSSRERIMKRERSSVLDFTANEICRYLCVALLGLAPILSNANPIAITNVRIIDGNGGVPIE